MPYPNIEKAKEASFPTEAEGIPLTLAQINKLAEIYDSIKAEGTADNPMAVAWTTWKKIFEKKGDSWVKKETDNMAKTETLENVEIFKVGTWNGHTYTDEDLQDMEKNFNELSTQKILEPPMKLGHSKSQKLLQEDGYPAAGWISSVKKVGDKIVASFRDVPRRIAELIRNRAYKKVSCEIGWNRTYGGQIRKRVLEAVSLLGGDIPAVETLADVEALYGKNIEYFQNKFSEQGTQENIEIELTSFNKKEGEEMMEEELKKAKEDLKTANETIATLTKEKETAEQSAKTATDNLTKVTTEAENKEIETFVEKLTKEGKVIPAEKESVKESLKLRNNSTKSCKYTVDDGKGNKTNVDLTPRELFMRELEARPNIVDFMEKAKAGSPETGKTQTYSEGTTQESIDLHEKALKYSKENKVEYREALLTVTKKN